MYFVFYFVSVSQPARASQSVSPSVRSLLFYVLLDVRKYQIYYSHAAEKERQKYLWLWLCVVNRQCTSICVWCGSGRWMCLYTFKFRIDITMEPMCGRNYTSLLQMYHLIAELIPTSDEMCVAVYSTFFLVCNGAHDNSNRSVVNESQINLYSNGVVVVAHC